jgi:hypothetical protein
MYNNLKKSDYLHNKTQSEIEMLVNSFKVKYNNFKTKYHTEIEGFDKSLVRIIEPMINNGKTRNELLKLFNEPSNFTNVMEIVDEAYLNKITDVRMVTKNSASYSFILRGKYMSKPCYLKVFFYSEENLLYEQYIYRYIKTRNELIKPFYEEYFVKVYDVFKVSTYEFRKYLSKNNVKLIDNDIHIDWTETKLAKMLTQYRFINVIITEDMEGEPFGSFYYKNFTNEEIITKTLFDMIYGIYLLNDKLKIMHNDNHFLNVIIKTDLEEHESNYNIETTQYTRKKNYRLCIYDFDLSYFQSIDNPYLKKGSLAQNIKSAKDVWTILNSLSFYLWKKINRGDEKYRAIQYYINKFYNYNFYRSDYWTEATTKLYTHLDYIATIRDVIINNKEKYLYKLQAGFENYAMDGNFWNVYCIDNREDNCIIPNDDKELYPLAVLRRYINNEHLYKILGFTRANPFYKKYLKYKNKYITLKNKNMMPQ